MRSTRTGHRWAAMVVTAILTILAAAIAAPAQTLFSTLHSFNYLVDGWQPAAGLIQGIDGNLYGTVQYGGITQGGSIFKTTPAGLLTTIYTFCLQTNCPDGSSPQGGLVQVVDGTFYGTTYSGGANNYGTVFKITPAGKLTTLHSMCAQSDCIDGYSPIGSLVQGGDGNLYGVTLGGGTYSGGTIFKITPTGTLTTLYSFCAQTNCADGSGPTAGLVEASDGNFYGTTFWGGTYSDGIVFKISPTGRLTTLHSFDSNDGSNPNAALLQATDGNFYGTTYGYGTNGGGTVFKITPGGVLTTLHNFCSQTGCTDGGSPLAGPDRGD
ncbi:MAG TPA: choice-of-anchor tandem repeat GloVer-containing protein [Terriglobia bacterium]|nr:choice-of-anchor tandem repeat GloVer-containing protein [Terriglobia bacterium]